MNATITLSKTEFAPGETIDGNISWHGFQDVGTAEVRLFWQTQGKGSRDVGVVAVETLDLPGPAEQRSFSFIAPSAPPSFSGQLISLIWGVELVLEPGGSASQDIVIAPRGKEIPLDHPEWLEISDPFPKKGRLGS